MMRVRIGFKNAVPFFPNAGILVIRVTKEQWRTLYQAAEMIRLVLGDSKYEFVCELS